MAFRRDFDAEAVAIARGKRPARASQQGPMTAPPDPMPVDRVIVITATDSVLPALLATSCSIKPVGADWMIEARDRPTFDSILNMLRLRGVHGMLRRKR